MISILVTYSNPTVVLQPEFLMASVSLALGGF